MIGPGRRPEDGSRLLRTLGATIAIVALAVGIWLLVVEREEPPAEVPEPEREVVEREPEPAAPELDAFGQ